MCTERMLEFTCVQIGCVSSYTCAERVCRRVCELTHVQKVCELMRTYKKDCELLCAEVIVSLHICRKKVLSSHV